MEGKVRIKNEHTWNGRERKKGKGNSLLRTARPNKTDEETTQNEHERKLIKVKTGIETK